MNLVSDTMQATPRRIALARSFGVAAVVAGAVAVVAAITGCSGDVDGRPRSWQTAGGGPVPSASASSGPAPTQPLLVDVDTNQTLETTPGSGLGVYVEYVAGGHWNIWWTCDTDKTGYDCHYQVDASIADGAIANVAGVALDGADTLIQPDARSVSAVTTTSRAADGVQFDAPAGAIVQVSVKLDADVYFFFVQDKKVNGGYTGALTNPLQFHPSSP